MEKIASRLDIGLDKKPKEVTSCGGCEWFDGVGHCNNASNVVREITDIIKSKEIHPKCPLPLFEKDNTNKK